MTTQIYNAELVELLRSVFPDKSQYATFGYNVSARWFDYPLNDKTDGNHFNDNDDSYPQGWTEVDAATSTSTNSLYGFWFLQGGVLDLSWKYRTQLSYNVENDTQDGDWVSFVWGPILFRDTVAPSDFTYRFGHYADNAGSIDEDIFVRVALNWDSSAVNWRVRGEVKDGTTQTNGSWFTLSQYPLVQPIYLRTVLRYRTSGAEKGRAYIGSTYRGDTHTQLMNPNLTVTWGQVWMQVQQTRNNTGKDDYLLIGGIDRGDIP